jgi:type VI secretion system secreted protein Hcp
MSVDYFLKIDGIDGESTDSKHTNEIQIASFRWNETQSADFSRGATGGGSGKVQMGTFEFTMRANKASPKLMLACATGAHIKNATLTCRKAGKDQQEFYKLTLTNILVASYTTASSLESIDSSATITTSVEAAEPTDRIQFAFGKIEVEYRAQKVDGSLDNPIKTGYDLITNTTV